MQSKKRLKSIDEQKANFKEAINKLNVDEQMVFVDMNDCLLEITELKEEAKLVNSNSEVAHNRLSNQYEIIDKLTAIQTLKKSGTYQTIRTLLSSTNPSLLTELDNIPDSLPDDTFKISLSNPLTLSTIQIDTDKISEIDQKISEIGQKITETENKLPNGININNLDSKINDLSTDKNNLSTEIANFELKDSDTITIQDLENSMSNIQDHTSKQYKTLEMKRDHLVLKEKVKVAESDVQNLKDEIVENGDSQDTLKNLKEKQDYLKILQEKLQNDSYSNLKESYSKTNSDLEELQKFQKELQKLQRESQTLQSEKKYFEAPRNLANIDSITQQLENSNIPRGNMTISNIFKSILQNIEEKKENLPIKPQPTRSGPTRSSGSGR